jgi:hypothetical protein
MPGALVIAAALAAALAAGCRDPRLEKLREIRDEVCACKTPACADAAMKKVPQDDVKPDHRAQVIAQEMLECLHERYLADKPSTDPDAEVPAPEPAPAPEAPGAAGAAPPAPGAR